MAGADAVVNTVSDYVEDGTNIKEVVPTYIGTSRNLTDQCSEIDDHPPSRFSCEDFGR